MIRRYFPIWLSLSVVLFFVVARSPRASFRSMNTSSSQVTAPPHKPTQNNDKALEDYCKLAYHDKLARIRELEARGDVIGLRLLSSFDSYESTIAAAAVCKLLPSADAIAYCRYLRTSSGTDYCPRWFASLQALASHTRGEILPYYREVAASSDTARSYCYLIAIRRNWTDFQDYALADIDNPTTIQIANQFGAAATLGGIARFYLMQLGYEVPPSKIQ